MDKENIHMAQHEEIKSGCSCGISLKEQEDSLLAKWKKCLEDKCEKAKFIKDGIVNEQYYTYGDHIRILYLLKETNGFKDFGYDLRKFIDGGAREKGGKERHATWDNIIRWTYGIYNIYGKEQTWKEIKELKAGTPSDTLRSICAVNVKKTSGKDTAIAEEIIAAAIEYGELIREQIENARPELIILCGSVTKDCYQIIKDNPKWKQTSRGIEYYIDENGRVCVSYCHPEARVPDNLLYYSLTDAVKEILSQPELNNLRSKYTWTKAF